MKKWLLSAAVCMAIFSPCAGEAQAIYGTGGAYSAVSPTVTAANATLTMTDPVNSRTALFGVIDGFNAIIDATGAANLFLKQSGTTIVSVTGLGASVTGTLAASGVTTPTGGIAAAGGFSVSPRNFATCAVSAGAATSMFTDQTPVATEVYAAEVFVPANATVTGVAIRSGSVASGNVKVGLADVSGNVLKTSVSTAVAGAAGVYQRVPFTSGTYAAVGPATYYVLTFFDNATVRASAHTQGNCGAGKLTGQTYATGFVSNASLAPTTFTTALGPVASLY